MALQPAGWPIVEPGLVMSYVGPIMVVYVDARQSEATHQRHLRELAREIDERQRRVGVLYDTPTLRGFEASRRKELAELLNARRSRLQATTAAYALVTGSSIVRGILRAVFWMAPPPYQTTVVATPREGFTFIATHLPEVDAASVTREYAALLARHGIRRLGDDGAKAA